jgi:putative heme-binding domain-containing protein
MLPMMKGDLRDLALELLSSRKAWAGVLVAEVGRGRVAKGQVPRRIIRRLLGYGDSRLSGEVTKTWGKLEVADAAAIRAKVEAVKKTIEAGTGNPYEGERLFMARCGRCHRLFADGGEVGPDLTSYQREDLERMIANIVAPSSEIRTGYENNLLITRDGRTLEGFLADSGSKTVALRTIEGQTVVLPREKILQLRVLETSVMPEDLLREYNEQQLRDLFAYLRSTQPLP